MSPARSRVAALLLAAASTTATAGPPYLTDDPEPTDVGHWETYAFTAADGHGSDLGGDVGLDLNYGAVENLQLTATVPLSYSHAPDEGWSSGAGDLEFGAKYRFVHDEALGFSAAAFPRLILPTASDSAGGEVRVLLPIWLQENLPGGTSIFGGGGYTLNGGAGNRDFWQAAVAFTRDVGHSVSVGAELAWQESDTADGSAETSAGLGMVVQLSDRYGLLFSAGPTWVDHRTDYRLYAGVGLYF